MSPKHFLAVLFFASTAALAQIPTQPINPCVQQQACFFAQQSATISSSSSITLTVQQPTTGSARAVNFIGAVAFCNGQSFTIAQAQNGTNATATAGTVSALIPIQTTGGGTAITATATAWTSSNVGGGTATAPTLPYASGTGPQTIDLSQRNMSGNAGAAGPNYSITVANTGAASCSGGIAIYWTERI